MSAQARVLWGKGPFWSGLACSVMARFGRDGPPTGIAVEDALLRVPLLPHGAFLHDYSSAGWVSRGTAPPGPSLEGARDTVAVYSKLSPMPVLSVGKFASADLALPGRVLHPAPIVCIYTCMFHRVRGWV